MCTSIAEESISLRSESFQNTTYWRDGPFPICVIDCLFCHRWANHKCEFILGLSIRGHRSVYLFLCHFSFVAPHSSTLAWKIPWMEEPGRLQSMRSLRVGDDWTTSLHFSLSCIGEGNGNPLQCSCLENPRDGGARWAAIYGVAQSRTQLKQLSSSRYNIHPI